MKGKYKRCGARNTEDSTAILSTLKVAAWFKEAKEL